jgi:hypothetical protein
VSHFTTIKTKIKDKECLIEALRKINTGSSQIEENASIKGYRGRRRNGDVVVKTGRSFDVGFIKESDGSYQMVADWWGVRRDGMLKGNHLDFLNDVQKEYTVSKVIKTVTKRGFRVQSQRVTPTGEIKLLVAKRGWTR